MQGQYCDVWFLYNVLAKYSSLMKYCLRLIVLLLLGATGVGAQTISGPLSLCTGNTIELTGTPAGGTWHSSNPSVAFVTDSTAGVITPVAAGTATIYYTVGGSPVSVVVTVNASPAPITSGGGFAVCAGSNLFLSSATPAGTWSSVTPSVATVSGSGVVSAIVPGSSIISYTLSTGCAATATVAVMPSPAAISGASSACAASSVLFTNTAAGGTWSSSAPLIASVDFATGLVTGGSTGLATITYQLSTGCFTTKHIFIHPLPAPISGPPSVCTGQVISLSSSPSGGTWSVAGTGAASVSATSGVVSGLSAGVETVSYTLSTGCSSTRSVTVNTTPGPISGNAPFCPGATLTLSNSLDGGVWVSSSTAIATVSGAGSSAVVSGISAGTATISYVTAGGCSVTEVVTVMPLPNAGVISGPGAVCEAAAITLSSTSPGGVWASGDLSIASAGAGGVVAGVAAGVAPISYTVTNSCGVATATTNVTVTPMPAAITGTASFCQGASSIFADAVPGGSWSSATPAVASVGSSSGVVTGVNAGTAVIFYSIAPAGCNATRIVTVNPAPGPIGGAGAVCVGNVLGLADTAAGGIWTSSNPAIATILSVGGSTGVVNGLAPGVVTVTYSIGSCAATASVTVNPLPSVTITNTPNSCGGSTVLAASGTSVSYEWLPAAGLSCTGCSIATAAPSGGPVYSVTGTDINGCSKTETITIPTDRIFGHVLYGGTPPVSPRANVWLIQYDPADSSIMSVDSTVTCLDGAEQYYEFTAKPAGRYAVLARQEMGTPGISGYVPTYAGDKVHWFNSSAISHAPGGADGYDVSMVYGNVPSGPGYIGGYLYAGDNSGNGVLTAGVLVLLKDASGQVVTYTYTNSAGIFTFSGLALGTYTIYPEVFDYYTTTSSVTLTATSVFQLDVTFKKDTGSHTIYPFTPSGVHQTFLPQDAVTIYPNPAHGVLNISSEKGLENASVSLYDVTGRNLLTENVKVSSGAVARVDVSALSPGVYMVTVTGGGSFYTGRIVVE